MSARCSFWCRTFALRVALVFGCGCDWCEADAGGDVVPVPMMAVPPMLLYN